MAGRVLKIARTFTRQPETSPCSDITWNVSQACLKPGILPEVVAQLLRMAGASYKLIRCAEGSAFKNGTWLGCPGKVFNGTYDTINVFWLRTSVRSEYFDFTIPIFQEQPVFISAKRKLDLMESAMVPFQVFKAQLWISIALMLASLLAFPLILTLIQCKKFSWEKLWNLFLITIDHSEIVVEEKLLGGKIVVAILGFFACLYLALYQGTLLTHLLHPPEPRPFSDSYEMMEMIKKKELTVLTASTTYWYIEAARYSNDPYFVRLRQALDKNPPMLVRNRTEIVEMLHTGSYVYPERSVRAKWIVSRDCHLTVVSGNSLPTYSARLMLTKNSSWIPILDQQILRSYGFISDVISKYIYSSQQCQYENQHKKSMIKAINLFSLFGVFCIYFCGCIIAFVGFYAERHNVRLAGIPVKKLREVVHVEKEIEDSEDKVKESIQVLSRLMMRSEESNRIIAKEIVAELKKLSVATTAFFEANEYSNENEDSQEYTKL